MLLFLISVAVTVFLIAAMGLLILSGKETIDARLMGISAAPVASSPEIVDVPTSGLARAAAGVTGIFKPIRGLLSGSDADMGYQLTLAGFRKPEHIEIFTAIKMLLPILAIAMGTFFSGNMIVAIMVGAVIGYMGPDLILTNLISRRQDSVRRALPDALDLLVICMEAGLGIEQAMVRVGEEMRLTSPALADEIQIINREQRAGKPRV